MSVRIDIYERHPQRHCEVYRLKKIFGNCEVIRMLPGWVWWYVLIVNVLQLLGPLLLIAGIGLTVYLVVKELIKFNKKS